MSRKARADTTSEIRGALKRALKMMEEKGRPLSTIWLELFADDPATAMKLAISTMPKDMNVTQTNLSPEDWLTMMAEQDVSQSESTESANTVPGQFH